jgi:hypothetical protein
MTGRRPHGRRDHVGQIVLALRVVAAQLQQPGAQLPAPEAAMIPALTSRICELRRRRVLVFDDRADAPALSRTMRP